MLADYFWYRTMLLKCWWFGHIERTLPARGLMITDCWRCGEVLGVNGERGQ